MTLCRCRDAGLSPWLAFVFFIPYANYIQMLTLSILPGRAPQTSGPRPARIESDRLPRGVDGDCRLDVAGLAAVFVSVQFFRTTVSRCFLADRSSQAPSADSSQSPFPQRHGRHDRHHGR